MKTCQGCGAEKDQSALEVYPYQEQDSICDGPIEPLFDVECVGDRLCKRTTVCHECFHKLSPDMWIDKKTWESIHPTVSFSELPAWS
jgi:hypothetical protein